MTGYMIRVMRRQNLINYQMNTQTFHKLGKEGIVRDWMA